MARDDGAVRSGPEPPPLDGHADAGGLVLTGRTTTGEVVSVRLPWSGLALAQCQLIGHPPTVLGAALSITVGHDALAAHPELAPLRRPGSTATRWLFRISEASAEAFERDLHAHSAGRDDPAFRIPEERTHARRVAPRPVTPADDCPPTPARWRHGLHVVEVGPGGVRWSGRTVTWPQTTGVELTGRFQVLHGPSLSPWAIPPPRVLLLHTAVDPAGTIVQPVTDAKGGGLTDLLRALVGWACAAQVPVVVTHPVWDDQLAAAGLRYPPVADD